ncbi:Probable flavin-containing monooxygenase 1 [Striga hermonthica]|uniref:Flavin-containing monooxygenase n=1 Tax=Striga hermonthica TaxID=68872 RepID=A0A9N7RB51_STRHE|nr:Probable flavin-containing monooxygenase 1 [Striga hermonthica]
MAPPTKSHKIGIIGCGISGIAAAKQLSEHEPVVFEATDSIGGVWRHCSYTSTKLQTPRCDFEFSDFPWSTQTDYATDFPSYQEILDYLYSYATYFDVLRFVKFNSKVVELRYIGEPENSGEYGNFSLGHPVWEVGVKTTQSQNIQWYEFEFLVICTGKYGDVAAIPKFPENKGPEIFEGKVLHTIDYCKLNQDESTQLLKDKKVVVVGYKKSAIDLAVECAEANQVELDGGERLDADVVVLATGFDGKQKLKAIFPDSFRALLDFPNSMMPLYRGTINPLIPNTAFVGYIESVSNLQTAEIRCKWLSRLLAGHFKLPSSERMLWHITEEMEIMKRATRFFKRSCISTFSINHTDHICEEMGWNSWRKPNWLAEAFSPYTSRDYRQHQK